MISKSGAPTIRISTHLAFQPFLGMPIGDAAAAALLIDIGILPQDFNLGLWQ
jgi:hypothetical protein